MIFCSLLIDIASIFFSFFFGLGRGGAAWATGVVGAGVTGDEDGPGAVIGRSGFGGTAEDAVIVVSAPDVFGREEGGVGGTAKLDEEVSYDGVGPC